MLTRTSTKGPPVLITMDTIKEGQVDWLWYPYIPLGAITSIYGRGGMGKSHITTDLASRISRGDPFPLTDQTKQRPHNVLMLSAEDDYAKVLRPRLRKAQANATRIGVPDTQFVMDEAGVARLDVFLTDWPCLAVFIDPIVYYMGSKIDINRSNEVRATLTRLSELSAKHNCAIIIVGHTRKGSEGHDADSMMGSADWVNGTRSALLATYDNEGKPLMRHTKANWGPRGTSIGYELNEDGFEWTSFVSEDELVKGLPGRSGKKRGEAAAWLKETLQGGPIEAGKLIAMAAEAGHSQATVYRAKGNFADSKYSVSLGGYYWMLT